MKKPIIILIFPETFKESKEFNIFSFLYDMVYDKINTEGIIERLKFLINRDNLDIITIPNTNNIRKALIKENIKFFCTYPSKNEKSFWIDYYTKENKIPVENINYLDIYWSKLIDDIEKENDIHCNKIEIGKNFIEKDFINAIIKINKMNINK